MNVYGWEARLILIFAKGSTIVVFTTRLSARLVAEPHVTHTTPVDIREY